MYILKNGPEFYAGNDRMTKSLEDAKLFYKAENAEKAGQRMVAENKMTGYAIHRLCLSVGEKIAEGPAPATQDARIDAFKHIEGTDLVALHSSDGMVFAVKKPDFDRAFGTMINNPAVMIKRDYGVPAHFYEAIIDVAPTVPTGNRMCFLGYREPSIEEANVFLQEDLAKAFGSATVRCVEEISAEKANEAYDLTHMGAWPVFADTFAE